MGQKVHPIGFRIGQQYTWRSRWFADGAKYQKQLLEDIKIRDTLIKRLKPAGISKVDIERTTDKIHLRLFVARPGVVVGRGGTGMEQLKKFVATRFKINPHKLKVDVEEIKNPDLDAYLVATWVADQLVRRIPHRRVMARMIERVISAGAKGVKISLSGRVGGAEIARTEHQSAGSVPLQTLRGKIDYAHVPALTKSGYVGVKVWINKG